MLGVMVPLEQAVYSLRDLRATCPVDTTCITRAELSEAVRLKFPL
jgi:hypothetical protein